MWFVLSSAVFFAGFLLPVCHGHVGSGESDGWSYRPSSPTCDGSPNNLCSPLYWGNLYPQCDGKVQSPINLAEAVHNDFIQPPQFRSISGGCKEWLMGASTSSFSAQFSASGCYNLTMTFEGVKYYLEQLHFHSPSEHTHAKTGAAAVELCGRQRAVSRFWTRHTTKPIGQNGFGPSREI